MQNFRFYIKSKSVIKPRFLGATGDLIVPFFASHWDLLACKFSEFSVGVNAVSWHNYFYVKNVRFFVKKLASFLMAQSDTTIINFGHLYVPPIWAQMGPHWGPNGPQLRPNWGPMDPIPAPTPTFHLRYKMKNRASERADASERWSAGFIVLIQCDYAMSF